MEIVGLILGCLKFGVAGIILSAILIPMPKFRRFALSAAILPASSYFLLIILSWLVLDRSPICGPDPEWDRCPSHVAQVVRLACGGLCLSSLELFLCRRFFRVPGKISSGESSP
jgi:hypothetical protein